MNSPWNCSFHADTTSITSQSSEHNETSSFDSSSSDSLSSSSDIGFYIFLAIGLLLLQIFICTIFVCGFSLAKKRSKINEDDDNEEDLEKEKVGIELEENQLDPNVIPLDEYSESSQGN